MTVTDITNTGIQFDHVKKQDLTLLVCQRCILANWTRELKYLHKSWLNLQRYNEIVALHLN